MDKNRPTMTASARGGVIDPHLLTTAALAWTVLNRPPASQKVATSAHEHDEFEDIPEIHAEISTLERTPKSAVPGLIASPSVSDSDSPLSSSNHVARVSPRAVLPVVISSAYESDDDDDSQESNTAPAAVPRVSAATLRNIQARRRVQSAMNQYKHQQATTQSPNKPTPHVVDSPTVDYSTLASMPPPSEIHLNTLHEQVIRFKVKNITSNEMIRFQCLPEFTTIQDNIVERLRLTSQAKITITFTDVDGDTCVLSDDADVADAIAACDKDIVRLDVEQETKSFYETVNESFATIEQESKNLLSSLATSFSVW